MDNVTVQLVIDVASLAKEIADGAIAVHKQTGSDRMMQYYMDTCEEIILKVKELSGR